MILDPVPGSLMIGRRASIRREPCCQVNGAMASWRFFRSFPTAQEDHAHFVHATPALNLLEAIERCAVDLRGRNTEIDMQVSGSGLKRGEKSVVRGNPDRRAP